MGIETLHSVRCARLRSHGGGRCCSGPVWLPRAVVLLAGLVAACGSPSERPARDARRVVSLAPAITDLVFALGAGDRLVGRTRWDTYPPEARFIPSVGDGLLPSVEAIAAREPDLVLLYETNANATALARLAELRIPSRELAFDRLGDVAAAARALGPLLGREPAGDSIANAMETWLAEPRPRARWRVAFVIADTPLITIGAGSYLSELVERAGASNVFGDLPEPSPLVGLETLAIRDPDALLVLGEGGERPAFLGRPEWHAVRAARTGRVVMLRGAHFSYPSVRASLAVRELRTALEELP